MMNITNRAKVYKTIREAIYNGGTALDMSKATLIGLPATYAIPVDVDLSEFGLIGPFYAKVSIGGLNPEEFKLPAAIEALNTSIEQKAVKKAKTEQKRAANAGKRLADAAAAAAAKERSIAIEQAIYDCLANASAPMTIAEIHEALPGMLDNLTNLRVGSIIAKSARIKNDGEVVTEDKRRYKTYSAVK